MARAVQVDERTCAYHTQTPSRSLRSTYEPGTQTSLSQRHSFSSASLLLSSLGLPLYL